MDIKKVKAILAAPWIPHPEPLEWSEVGGPIPADTDSGLKRMLLIVSGPGAYYILAQDEHDKVHECWKVLL